MAYSLFLGCVLSGHDGYSPTIISVQNMKICGREGGKGLLYFIIGNLRDLIQGEFNRKRLSNKENGRKRRVHIKMKKINATLTKKENLLRRQGQS